MSTASLKTHQGKLYEPYPATVTTTLFISNLHCSSCIEIIQQSISALDPAPEFISYSIVSHSVVLCHSASLAIDDISGSLEAAGFEIHSIIQDHIPARIPVEVRNPAEHDMNWQSSLEQAVSSWTQSRDHARELRELDMHKQAKHIQQCGQCKAEAGGVALEMNNQFTPEPVVFVAEKTSMDGASLHGPISPAATSFVLIDKTSTPIFHKATLALPGVICSSCVSSIRHAVEELPWVQSIHVDLLTSSGTVIFDAKHRVEDIIKIVEDTGFDAMVENLAELPSPVFKAPPLHNQRSERWRATYAVDGMTCSSCVGNVTDSLKSHAWIEKVDVNLLLNSATVIFLGKHHLQEIEASIEDSGYDATLNTIISDDSVKENALEKSVSVHIRGMFCHRCPENITRELREEYGNQSMFKFDGPPFSQSNPFLGIRYIPNSPNFTIRHIFQTITNLDPSFKPAIYHPPTIEECAKQMLAHERRRTLFRLTLSIIVAIPTFVLGVVIMSLVKASDPVRKYAMQPIWAGRATRLNWALFILASPVYFFAADTFHLRAMKELRAIWRPGSRTPFLRRFYRFGSMNMLMSLGTSIAYFASVVELALAATKKSSGSMTDSYFDSVVFLTLFLLVGRFLEAYSKAKTGDAVTSLGKLRPEEATLVDAENGDQRAATDLLEIGDVVRIHHGTSPPFDGIVLEGNAIFDESSLTGESRPVQKEAGDTVFSGTMNKGQPIKVKVTTMSGTSMLDQIIIAVREGQTRRAPVERVADTITSHFVPFVVLMAILTWVTWLIVGTTGAIPRDWKNDESGDWALWSLRFAIAVFVIACPCGIGLAAPTALFVGAGLAAKHGILVKGGGEAFQGASKLDCIVFDKTGTLTQGGDPAVTNHQFAGSQGHALVFGIVKALEENSNHPIAKAIVSFCKSQSLEIPTVVNINEVPGKGLKGKFKVAGREVTAIVGNEAYMADHQVSITTEEGSTLQTWKSRGESVALIAILISPVRYSTVVDGDPSDLLVTPSPAVTAAPPTWELSAIFAIADPLRPEAVNVIRALRNRGIDVWMLSGDNQTTANAVGAQVGIEMSNIIAGVLPDQKAEKIKYLQKTLARNQQVSLFRNPFLSKYCKYGGNRATVAMVGDGINDAPALVRADLSIAIGSGSDIALSSSSFILINSHLGGLLTLLDLSRVVFRRVYFNFGWALTYNLIAMPIAAGVLYPITTGNRKMSMHHQGIVMEGGMGTDDSGQEHVRLDPVWASLVMALSSVSVVCSSLALRSRVPGLGFRAMTTVGDDVKEQQNC